MSPASGGVGVLHGGVAGADGMGGGGAVQLHVGLPNGWRVGLALLVLIAALTACGSGSVSTSRSSPTPATGAVVLAAYRAATTAFVQAVQAADPEFPALAATMTDPLLQSVKDNLRVDQQKGVVGRGTLEIHPRIESITGDTAVVVDCVFDKSALVYVSTLQPVPPATGPQHDGVRATFVRVSPGIWKESQREVTKLSCPAGL